jgi:hypothetical protein
MLSDGRQEVTSIGVFLYFRDNERYLTDFLFPILEKIEARHAPHTRFTYYAMENDSKDGTRDVIARFMEGRDGLFVTESLAANNIKAGTSFPRIARIAGVRNRLLGKVRERLGAHQWCWFVDSNIYFGVEVLDEIFASRPAAHGIGMLGINTTELQENKGQYGKDVPAEVPYVTQNHYYDTFAYIGSDDRMPYPACMHPDCVFRECAAARERKEGAVWDLQQDMIDVRSAWGGLVLVRADALHQHPQICWRATGIMHGNSLCEHVYFCDMLAAFTGLRIVILLKVSAYWVKDD